jgi:AcrR family transcriptional regulator
MRNLRLCLNDSKTKSNLAGSRRDPAIQTVIGKGRDRFVFCTPPIRLKGALALCSIGAWARLLSGLTKHFFDSERSPALDIATRWHLYTLTMARPAKYSDRTILDATATEVAESGLDGASVARVAKRLGAPSGSVYHRFPSRKHLLGALWVRTLKSFHDALEHATREPSVDDLAHRCVVGIFEWIHNTPTGSTLLLKFGTEDLIDNDWPTEIRVEVAEQNQRLADITNRVAEARGINPLDAILALVDIPTAAAHRAEVFDNDVVTAAIQGRITLAISPLLA